MIPRPDPAPVRWSERAYRALIALYPGTLRQRFGAEMIQVFRTQCRERYRRDGGWGVLRLWPAALADWAAGVALAHLTAPFWRMRAWLLGAVALALGLILYGPVGYSGHDTPGTVAEALVVAALLAGYGAAVARMPLGRAWTRAAVWGGLLGGLCWLLNILFDPSYGLLSPVSAAYSATSAPQWALVWGACASYALAGMLARGKGGSRSEGALAGLVAMAISAVVWVSGEFALTYGRMDVAARATLHYRGYLHSGMHDPIAFGIQDNLDGSIILLTAGPIIGLALGAAGAVLWAGTGVLSGGEPVLLLGRPRDE